MTALDVAGYDFVCASSPCEEFSVHGMKHFHPNPKYPEMGLKLFNHTRLICEVAEVPYVMENVRPAQKFVGPAVAHCGPFYLWGNGVPPLLPQGIRKNMDMGSSIVVKGMSREEIKAYRRKFDLTRNSSKSKARKEATAKAATIPAALANAVADYASALLAGQVLDSERGAAVDSQHASLPAGDGNTGNLQLVGKFGLSETEPFTEGL
jgi:hypothetical protein